MVTNVTSLIKTKVTNKDLNFSLLKGLNGFKERFYGLFTNTGKVVLINTGKVTFHYKKNNFHYKINHLRKSAIFDHAECLRGFFLDVRLTK